MTLQWGETLADRFGDEQAATPWARLKCVADLPQAEEAQWTPGFEGAGTCYFDEVPKVLRVDRFPATLQV